MRTLALDRGSDCGCTGNDIRYHVMDPLLSKKSKKKWPQIFFVGKNGEIHLGLKRRLTTNDEKRS